MRRPRSTVEGRGRKPSSAADLMRDLAALAWAMRDRRTPWYAKALAGLVVAYAASPIDLIPGFIPVLGRLDDALLVPLGVRLVLRLVPEEVMTESRRKAASSPPLKRMWAAVPVVVALWVLAALWIWGLVRGLRR